MVEHLRAREYPQAITDCYRMRRMALEAGQTGDAAAALAVAARAARLAGDLNRARRMALKATREEPGTGSYELAKLEEDLGSAHAQQGRTGLARAAFGRAARRYDELVSLAGSRQTRQLWERSARDARARRESVG